MDTSLCVRQRAFWPRFQNLAMEAQQLIVQFCLLQRRNVAEVLMDREFFLKAVFWFDPLYLSDVKMLRNLDEDGEYGVESQHHFVEFLKLT